MLKCFYCAECGKVHKISYHSVLLPIPDQRLTIDMYFTYKCDCGNEADEIDYYMIDIIKQLNDIGLKTEYCCEGHIHKNGDYEPAYIQFNNSISIRYLKRILKVYPLPVGWKLEYQKYTRCVRIRYTELDNKYNLYTKGFQSMKINYIIALTVWVHQLESIKRIKSSDNNE